MNAAAPAPLLAVVGHLGDVGPEVVFVGGQIRGLLITDPGAAPDRVTDDVDCIVQLTSRFEYYALGRRLRDHGFKEDDGPGAPICRWIVAGIPVDVMPTAGTVLGFRNRWYPSAMAHAVKRNVAGVDFRILDGPHFCATKLEAYADRGKGDPYHHDLEDVVALVDGRAELLDEARTAPTEIRAYIAQTVRDLLGQRKVREALSGHLPGDDAGQGRLPLLLERLKALASLSP